MAQAQETQRAVSKWFVFWPFLLGQKWFALSWFFFGQYLIWLLWKPYRLGRWTCLHTFHPLVADIVLMQHLHPFLFLSISQSSSKLHEHSTSQFSSEASPLHRSLASTFFNQLVQTKQSPRNANSAVTQVWGNLKPVGNVRLVGGKSFGKTHPGCLDRWGKGESWQMQPILGKRLSRSVFKISQKRKLNINDPNLNLPV